MQISLRSNIFIGKNNQIKVGFIDFSRPLITADATLEENRIPDIVSIGLIGYTLMTLEEITLADIQAEQAISRLLSKIGKLHYSNELCSLISNLMSVSLGNSSSVLSSTFEAIEKRKIVKGEPSGLFPRGKRGGGGIIFFF